MKHRLCDMWSGVVMENLALSADQCQLRVLQFSVHLIDLLSVSLRYNGFTRIQKAVVVIRQAADHQTITMTFLFFFGSSLALGTCLEEEVGNAGRKEAGESGSGESILERQLLFKNVFVK